MNAKKQFKTQCQDDGRSQTSKTAKIFWGTLNGALQGGPYKLTLVDSHYHFMLCGGIRLTCAMVLIRPNCPICFHNV